MKFLCLFIVIVAVYEVNASSKRLCGPVLVQVLETICIDGYNSHKTKKSVPLYNELNGLDMYNDIENFGSSEANSLFLDNLLMDNHVNTVAKTRRRRNLLGIYDECCVKGCDFNELASYCI